MTSYSRTSRPAAEISPFRRASYMSVKFAASPFVASRRTADDFMSLNDFLSKIVLDVFEVDCTLEHTQRISQVSNNSSKETNLAPKTSAIATSVLSWYNMEDTPRSLKRFPTAIPSAPRPIIPNVLLLSSTQYFLSCLTPSVMFFACRMVLRLPVVSENIGNTLKLENWDQHRSSADLFFIHVDVTRSFCWQRKSVQSDLDLHCPQKLLVSSSVRKELFKA